MHAGNYSLDSYEEHYPLAVECIRHLKTHRLARQDFPKKLRQRRETLKIEKREIASKAGITIRAYDLYEQGQRIPRPDTFSKLSVLLKIPIRELGGCKS